MEIGLVRNVDIDHEMQQSYLDYAMSVIVSRALPDARDGLKPVQRRILYGMYDMGIRADSSYKKSARIVGEVLGKYHPHGDQSVYEAMARMAQEFSVRYPLVDGQGNFGSVDGDPPAAMRYTEARLSKLAVDILAQLDRDTVKFTRNFDDTLSEPEVLPSAIPNLLVNGASGIAVGMATSIPPHNLTEVVDALIFMVDEWEHLEDVAVDDLMKFIKGPDFPTGGIILQESGADDLLSAYATGRGKVTIRGRVQLEEMGRGRSRIIITELPYQINKSSLIERIAELARDGDLEGISDLRDESDRQGMRIVIELNKVAEEEHVLRELYKRTPLQSTFRISLLALVDGEPHLLALKPALRVFLEHRIEVVRRRTEFDLTKARQRAHILEGLRIALKNLDEIINLIRRSDDVDDARQKLMKRYKLSDLQANAILEMQLRRLAALERKKIDIEYQEVVTQIKGYEGLLASPSKLRQQVAEELKAVKQSYGDRRKTQIVSLKQGDVARDILTTADLIPEQSVWVGILQDGMIGRTHGDKLSKTARNEKLEVLLTSNTHETAYLITPDGRATALAVQSLPEVEKFSAGVHFHRVSPLGDEEKISAALTVRPIKNNDEEQFLVTVTRNGMVKKTNVLDLPGPSSQVFVAAKVNSGDEIGWSFITNGNDDLVLATRQGMIIRFSEDSVRPMGLAAAGVNGIKLSDHDVVIGAVCFKEESELLLVGSNGTGWRMPSSQLVKQGRYGQGTIACRMSAQEELAGLLYGTALTEGVAWLKPAGAIPIRIDQIQAGKRAVTGKLLLTLKPGESVSTVIHLGEGSSDTASSRSAGSPAGKVRRKTAEEKLNLDVHQPSLLDDSAVLMTSQSEKPARKSRVPGESDQKQKPSKIRVQSTQKTTAIAKAGPRQLSKSPVEKTAIKKTREKAEEKTAAAKKAVVRTVEKPASDKKSEPNVNESLSTGKGGANTKLKNEAGTARDKKTTSKPASKTDTPKMPRKKRGS